MILCLDVGNSHIFGGVFSGDQIALRFRHDTSRRSTSDQLGVFLKNVLREHRIDPNEIQQIAIASVVPAMDYSIRAACVKYFDIEPFVLKAGVKTGLKINYRNPLEVGADLIADAIAAVHFYPNRNIVIASFGTATVFCSVNADKKYLGCTITAGIRLCMDTLQENAAKLPSVEIVQARHTIGRSTEEAIQAGLYYSHVGLIREITTRITQEAFSGNQPVIIGTGGFVNLFESEQLFTAIMPDLILQGLFLANKMNTSAIAVK